MNENHLRKELVEELQYLKSDHFNHEYLSTLNRMNKVNDSMNMLIAEREKLKREVEDVRKELSEIMKDMELFNPKDYSQLEGIPEIVLKVSADALGITVEEMISKKRKGEYVTARRIASKKLREYKFTFYKIADMLKVDHSTVVHTIKAHNRDIIYQKSYQKKFKFASQMIDELLTQKKKTA